MTASVWESILSKPISTHTLTWSVTINNEIQYDNFDNFNSHAHVERDIKSERFKIFYAISTHTLTWSVTGNCAQTFLTNVISTHTLTWSVTY